MLRIKLFPTKRRLKFYFLTLLAITIVKIPWVWMTMESGKDILAGTTKSELLARRRYLIDRTYDAAVHPSEMPFHLPSQFKGEWALGTYSMTAAALTNIAFRFPETREESITVLKALLDRVLTSDFRDFDRDRWGEDPLESLDGRNGHIGYLGHLNWMLSAYHFLGGHEEKYEKLFTSITDALVQKLRASPGLCLETYPGERYVPDNVVVLASIANYARSHQGTHNGLLGDWLQYAKSHVVAPETGLLSFHLQDSCDGDNVTRGSGAGWNSYYLPFIDPPFAVEQFSLLKENLLQRRLITGLREYPRGVFGFGDIDSGPVLFGFSPSGTGFAIGGAAHTNEADLMTELLLTAEIVGTTAEWNSRRSYLVAPLVGDAIMLAMKTARVWDNRFQPTSP